MTVVFVVFFRILKGLELTSKLGWSANSRNLSLCLIPVTMASRSHHVPLLKKLHSADKTHVFVVT